jgi:polyphenol oxidase
VSSTGGSSHEADLLGRCIELPGGGRALFTARAEGNMSSMSGEGSDQGARARKRLCAGLGLQRLARGRQVHGSTVQRVRAEAAGGQPSPGRREADGQATRDCGVGAMVLAADCMPVALGCQGAVAMLHAGWRGLALGVLEEGVRAVRELAGTGEMVAVVGPCAGPCCYEVGPEVHAALARARTADGHIDLRAVARQRLLSAGVAHVQDLAACTICDERYFSHRREGPRAGRQAGVAWLS